MRLTPLLDDSGIDIVEIRGDADRTEVYALDFDSRQVRVGSLFFCVPGGTTDGHDHAAEAVRSGATVLVVERLLDLAITQVLVGPGQMRSAMGQLSSAFFGHPSRDLVMVGVTGTNGKTTVTHLVRSILDAAGIPTGVIGTLSGERTTPEAPKLQALLADARDEGRRALAMEVSSHALAQHRVDGVRFEVAAFTNLSHDHLDHHHSMEEYFAAKATLFTPARSHLAVVNVDDPWGERLAHEVAGMTVVPVRRSDASDITLAVGSSSFRWRGRQVALPLTGAFNVDNALLAAAVATSLDVDHEAVVEGLSTAPPVPGRMEVVTAGPPFAVLVDFAHTPAGLRVALSSARRLAGAGRVVCAFGCGGDRRGHRPCHRLGPPRRRGHRGRQRPRDDPGHRGPGGPLRRPGRGQASTGRARRRGRNRRRHHGRGCRPMISLMTSGGVALWIAVLTTPVLIRWLIKNNIGQQIREDGPQVHIAKAGTPTMGGIGIVAAVAAGYLLAHVIPGVRFARSGLLVMLAILGAALIGLADDLIKVRHRRSLGLNKRAKFGSQIALGLAFSLLAVYWAHASTAVSFTRYNSLGLHLGTALWVVWATVIIVAAANAVNLTDGLDGLAAGSSTFCFACLAIIGYWQYRHFAIYHVGDALDMALASVALAGACLGFLWWNAAPAKIFMGDTGSLSIGSGLAALCLLMNLDLLLPIIGGLFVIVTLSVVIQVVSFRLFHRRVFRMAPLHHHFELLGWPETTVIIRFWILAGLFAALGLGIFYGDYLSVAKIT